MLNRFAISFLAGLLLSLAPGSTFADTLKIAILNGLSGTNGLSGEAQLTAFRAAVDVVNARGGVLGGTQLEMVPMDNKSSPQEAVTLLNRVVDGDIHFVASTLSSVVHALSESIAKHNARNPEKPILLLNFSALDPALTESKCSFWHFRFEPHTDMQLNAMTSYMAAQRSIEKVYLINQDYAFGQAVSRTSREQLNAKRRAIAIVGDELVPLAKVKDFAPYVAKIRASGADSILTSNWGGDLTLLLKASSEMGLKANYYSLQAALFGTAAAVRAAGAANVKALWSWHLNATEGAWEQRILESRTKYKTNADLAYMPAFRTIEMFAAAVDLAGSTEPRKIAYAIEGLHWNGPTGDSWMRAEDHQVVAPMMLMSFAKAGTQGVRHDIEGTGYGWKTDVVVPAKDMVPPLRCTMARPPG